MSTGNHPTVTFCFLFPTEKLHIHKSELRPCSHNHITFNPGCLSSFHSCIIPVFLFQPQTCCWPGTRCVWVWWKVSLERYSFTQVRWRLRNLLNGHIPASNFHLCECLCVHALDTCVTRSSSAFSMFLTHEEKV